MQFVRTKVRTSSEQMSVDAGRLGERTPSQLAKLHNDKVQSIARREGAEN